MSSALLRLLLVAAFLGTFGFGRLALASAAGVEDLLAGQMIPSAAPALLGPITSVGRKGWDCKPEHVAAAQQWNAAELPTGSDSR
jgi:hypothetical protein